MLFNIFINIYQITNKMTYNILSSEDYYHQSNIFKIFNISEYSLIKLAIKQQHKYNIPDSHPCMPEFSTETTIIYVPFQPDQKNTKRLAEISPKSDEAEIINSCYYWINFFIKNFNNFIENVIGFASLTDIKSDFIYVNAFEHEYNTFISYSRFHMLIQDKITKIVSDPINMLKFMMNIIKILNNYNRQNIIPTHDEYFRY